MEWNDASPPTQDFRGELKELLKRIPRYARLSWLVLNDPNLNGRQKAALLAGLGYTVSPIDAIPGIIPVIGQLDDLAVVIYAVRWVLRSMPPERAEDYLSRSELTFEILDGDIELVKRYGKKTLKRVIAALGVGALAVWGAGKLAHKFLKDRGRG